MYRTAVRAASLLLAVTLPLLLTATAHAADVPSWVDEWADWVSRYGNTFYSSDYGNKIMDPAYVQSCFSVDNPSPHGTTPEAAVDAGYTTAWTSTGADAIEYNMSDFQTSLYYSDGGISPSDAVRANKDFQAIAASTYTDAHKLTATSSQLEATMKATGETAAEATKAAKAGQVFNTSKTINGAASVAEKEGKTAVATALKGFGKKAVSAAGRVISVGNVAADVVTAEQFGVWIGNGIVSVAGIDQTAECAEVRNGLARWALGINSKCQAYDVDPSDYRNFITYEPLVTGMDSLGTLKTVRHYYNTYIPTWRWYWITANATTNSKVITGASGTSYFFESSPHSGEDENYVVCDQSGGSSCWFTGPDPERFCADMPAKDFSSGAPVTCKLTTSAPDATTSTTVTGSDGNTYTSTSTGPADQSRAIPSVELPDGVTATNVTVSESYDGGTTSTQLYDSGTLPAYNADGSLLDLVQVSTGSSCYDLASQCQAWASEVHEATGKTVNLQNTDTTTTASSLPYKCTYGGKEVAIGECTALMNAFTPEALRSGQTASDPSTGAKESGVTEPAQYDQFDMGNCVGSGVSWNPVTWVFVPVSCALQWAFVPDPLALSDLKAQAQVSTSQTIVTDVQKEFHSVVPVVSEPNACEGPAFNLQFLGITIFPKDSHPLSVCPSSGLSFLPVISKAGLTALAGLLGLLVMRRRFSNLVGMDNEAAEGE